MASRMNGITASKKGLVKWLLIWMNSHWSSFSTFSQIVEASRNISPNVPKKWMLPLVVMPPAPLVISSL